MQREQQGLLAPPIEPVPRTAPLPLSFAQQRLWFLNRLEPNNAAYNIPHSVRLKGSLQPEVLGRSLNEIVRRHESLRTSFQVINDQPVQVIAAQVQVPLILRDLTTLPEANREEEARQLARDEAQRPFDLTVAPLMRATLLRLADDDHVLLLNTHHSASDGWSLSLFSRELASLYEAFASNLPSPLAELPIQYADYAVWQREYLAGRNSRQAACVLEATTVWGAAQPGSAHGPPAASGTNISRISAISCFAKDTLRCTSRI